MIKSKNPATNRCISKETAVKKNLIKSFVIQRSVTNLKITKVCPEGKVLNPKTNRCVKIKADNKPKSKSSIKVKVCPEGKVINPKTNRCVKIKADNKPKKQKVNNK
jgi:nucleoid DNA-binding protein